MSSREKFYSVLLISAATFFFTMISVIQAGSINEEIYGRVLKSIRISGLKHTDIDIITRELISKVGQPYLKENAGKDFAELDNLDLFSYIHIQPVADEDGVALEIEVIEIFPYLPFLSYEVTDENGFSAGPGLQSVNLGGRDIFFTGTARFGGATNVALFLENPWFAGNHLSYTLEFFQRKRFSELDQFNETATELFLTLQSYIGNYGRIGGRFSFESIASDSAGRTLSPDNRDNVPTLGFFVGYDSRDLWSNPHSGWWNEFAVSKSGFVGDSDFWRFTLDIRRYIPVIKRHTLALFSLSTLTTGRVGEDLAVWQDFSLGGTNSVRGWELDSRHGKNQFINTAEYRVTVLKPRLLTLPFGLTFDIGMQLAAFGDLAVAWDSNEEFKSDNFIGGYGLGLRFLVPFVNMFRFDFAAGEPGMSFKVHIGALEKAVAQRFRIR